VWFSQLAGFISQTAAD